MKLFDCREVGNRLRRPAICVAGLTGAAILVFHWTGLSESVTLATWLTDQPAPPLPESALPDFQNDQTFVVLALGQSNAASHGSHRASAGARCFAFHQGKFYPGTDPWVGGTGAGGSVWSRLAPLIIDQGLARYVVVACVAQGSTRAHDWGPGSACFPKVSRVLQHLSDRQMDVDCIIWHQGESDVIVSPADRAEYRSHLSNMINGIRLCGSDAPILVCVASTYKDMAAADIRRAQRSVWDKKDNVFPGTDTDAFGPELRGDGVHFNNPGFDAFADSLLDSIIRLQARQTTVNGAPLR